MACLPPCVPFVVGCICNPTWASVHALPFQKFFDNSRLNVDTTVFILSYVDMALLFLCINIGIDLLSSHLTHEPIMHVTVYFIDILIPFVNGSFIHQASISVPALSVTVGP